jgi:hypothetical protein
VKDARFRPEQFDQVIKVHFLYAHPARRRPCCAQPTRLKPGGHAVFIDLHTAHRRVGKRWRSSRRDGIMPALKTLV